MTARPHAVRAAALCALLLPPFAVGAAARAGLLALDVKQQRAAGILVAHAAVMQLPGRTDAFGRVLDTTALLSDDGTVRAASAAEHAAAAEAARLQRLYGAGAGASLKMLEEARAELAKRRAEFVSAAARFSLNWGPIAVMSAAQRHRLLDAAASGRALLLRADLPGRHSVGGLPRRALIDVDGARLPGLVLGALRQAADLQSAALLIETDHAPAGFGPGARVPVTLLSIEHSGRFLPRGAILYGDDGAYVYEQLPNAPSAKAAQYRRVKVTLVLADGDGWLVDGVGAGAMIVVQGAGVLWSLQGLGNQAGDDED